MANADAAEFEGVVEKIVYANPENHYVVVALRSDRENREEIAVGNIPDLSVGETLRIWGEYRRHARHGSQIRVQRYERILPASAHGILMYLSSGLVKGIGETFAGNLVKAFGEDTLRVIEEEPDKLRRVEGIGPKRQRDIVEAWQRHRAIHNVMMFLQGHGIGLAHAQKIYRQYGVNAIDVVRKNPYVLAREIRGIAFKTADRIAQSLGIEKDSAERIDAGIEYVLEELAGEGHCAAPFGMLAARAAAVLEVPEDAVAEAIEREAEAGLIRIVAIPGRPVYLARMLDAESGLAERLLALVSAPRFNVRIDIPRALAWVESRMGVDLSDGQKRTIAGALSEKVSVITGGPGVGKTTIVRALVEILEAKELRVALAAPTGRAAKRLEELTGRKAETIHRLLKYNPVTGGFEAGRDKPLAYDALIVDEASMLDVMLARDLVEAVPDSGALILVGDADQLPPVGPGKVFEDIIRSRRVPVFELTEIFRQSLESDIVRIAHMINAGMVPDGDSKEMKDFYFIEQESPDRAVETIKTLVKERIPQRFGLDPVRDIQVLSPMHRGPAGIDHLNRALQEILNPEGQTLGRESSAFRAGDRVMQTVNDYDKDVFNGDVGTLASVNRIDQKIQVDMGRGIVEYDFSELDELKLAYAVSIHKSQGSEYPAVVIPLFTQHYMMLSRKLLYTAVTRGKQLVVIVGTRKALGLAVRNTAYADRNTLLAERLSVGNEGMTSAADAMWLFRETESG